MSDKEIQMIMSLTGVDEKTAEQLYIRYETTEDVIDALLQKPVISGDKYTPAKPKIDSGLTPEQDERCLKGRWLQDRVNAVFSVAHSKTLPQLAASEEPRDLLKTSEMQNQTIVVPTVSQSQLDDREKTILPSPQSELPQ